MNRIILLVIYFHLHVTIINSLIYTIISNYFRVAYQTLLLHYFVAYVM